MTTLVALGDGMRFELPCSLSTFERRWRKGLRRLELVYIRFEPRTYANPLQIVWAVERP